MCHINTTQRCRSVDRLSLSHLPSYHVSNGVSQSGLFCHGLFLKLCHVPPLPLLYYIQPLQVLQGCPRGLCVDNKVNGYAIISEVGEQKMVV